MSMDRAVLENASDRYVVVRYIAEGGMGAIYLGKKLGPGGFEKQVILKQLLPEYTSDPKFIELFLREARISAQLDHANIVHTLDLIAAEGSYFIIMEYVHGADLRTVQKRARRRGKQLPPGVALGVGRGILEALAYAHKATGRDGTPLGLIHRDISPSNILLSGAGEVKLTDFGIAKMVTQKSIFRQVKGKVGYMSPEQAKGQPLDQRADLFSLAVCMYEALVGERLFVADFLSTPSMIYAQPVAPPTRKRPELPPEIDGLFAKALALDPTGRYQSAEAFLESLDAFTYRHGLRLSSSEMAAQLGDAVGNPDEWRREDATGPVGSTGIIEDDDEPHPSTASLAGREITVTTSMLDLGGRVRAPRADETPSSTGAGASWDGPTAASTPSARRVAEKEDEPTTDYQRPPPSELPVQPDGPTLLTGDDEPVERRFDPERTAMLPPSATPTPLIAVPRPPSSPPLPARTLRVIVVVMALAVLVVGVTLGVLLSGPDDPDDLSPPHHGVTPRTSAPK